MSGDFKDYFSDASQAYSKFRPDYPTELFTYLVSMTQQHKYAWDCATGNGQSAIALSNYFSNVIATDASENQIKNAIQKTGITYRVEAAENSSLETNSIDLITVAQAIHWFNLEHFSSEVQRVLNSNGVLAVWTYGLLDVSPEVNEIINHLYYSLLNLYWPPERNIIESEYRDIILPFHKMSTPRFQMRTNWSVEQLIGYLCTWSAVKKFESDRGFNPVLSLHSKLIESWGDVAQKHIVKWPLIVKAWNKTGSS